MNVLYEEDGGFRTGTIVEQPVMRVRLGRGRVLGEVEEYFVSLLTPGDTFLFAGRLLAFEGIRQNEVITSLAPAARDPKVPAYAGAKLPLSTHLAGRVRRMLAEPAGWDRFPPAVREWLAARNEFSRLQDEHVSDLRRAQAAARRLHWAEQRRAEVAHEVERWLAEPAALP